MAFFDDLGKGLTEMGKDILQKTKDTAGAVKLKAMISDEERRIAAQYKEIGRMFFESCEDCPEPSYESMFRAIREAKANIAEYSAQMNKINGVAHCPSCGRQASANAAFCAGCGAKLGEEQAGGGDDGAPESCGSCEAEKEQDGE